SGSALQADTGNAMGGTSSYGVASWNLGIPDISGDTILGFYIGKYPLRWTGVEGATTYIYTVDSINGSHYDILPEYGPGGTTVSLEYQIPGTTLWVPYQQVIFTQAVSAGFIPYTYVASGTQWQQSAVSSFTTRFGINAWDPRSRR